MCQISVHWSPLQRAKSDGTSGSHAEANLLCAQSDSIERGRFIGESFAVRRLSEVDALALRFTACLRLVHFMVHAMVSLFYNRSFCPRSSSRHFRQKNSDKETDNGNDYDIDKRIDSLEEQFTLRCGVTTRRSAAGVHPLLDVRHQATPAKHAGQGGVVRGRAEHGGLDNAAGHTHVKVICVFFGNA